MQITINKFCSHDSHGEERKGCHISITTESGKKTVNETDFFDDSCEIAAKVQQLYQLLRKHFEGQP